MLGYPIVTIPTTTKLPNNVSDSNNTPKLHDHDDISRNSDSNVTPPAEPVEPTQPAEPNPSDTPDSDVIKEEGNISIKAKVNDFVESTIDYDNGELYTSWAEFSDQYIPTKFFFFFYKLSGLNVENIDKEKYKEAIKNSLNLAIQDEYIKELQIKDYFILNMFICDINNLVRKRKRI